MLIFFVKTIIFSSINYEIKNKFLADKTKFKVKNNKYMMLHLLCDFFILCALKIEYSFIKFSLIFVSWFGIFFKVSAERLASSLLFVLILITQKKLWPFNAELLFYKLKQPFMYESI